MNDILEHFEKLGPDAKSLIRKKLNQFMEKPSYGKELSLNYSNVGINWTEEYGDDFRKAEGFYMMDGEWVKELSDEELGELF
jgi:hypothetical protein